MIKPEMVETLKRLTRGKFKLDQAELSELLEQIKAEPTEDIIGLVFPPKPVRKRAAKQPLPEWLQQMEMARQSLSWKAADAVSRLYLLADELDAELAGAKKKSFPAASRHIASVLTEEKTRDAFVKWVETFAVENHKI